MKDFFAPRTYPENPILEIRVANPDDVPFKNMGAYALVGFIGIQLAAGAHRPDLAGNFNLEVAECFILNGVSVNTVVTAAKNLGITVTIV